MPLTLLSFVCGPIENNVYLLADAEHGEAVVIDPSFAVEPVVQALQQHGWNLQAIWLTHAHFDHTAGIPALLQAFPAAQLALHPADLALYSSGGGAGLFRLPAPTLPKPQIMLKPGQTLSLGATSIEVRHTPGHTPGHVVFHLKEEGVTLCGDLIFFGSVGRTDLPGGDEHILLESIRTQILPLPPTTRLLSGHGPETSVGFEAGHNPYL